MMIRWLIRFCSVLICLGGIMLFLYGSKFLGERKKSITILAWQQVLDKQYLDEFEKSTGIQVYITYIDSNEELVAKLQATPNHGYDLIMPSDFFVPLLIKRDLIKMIDQSRLSFWQDLYPSLLHQEYDLDNQYTIPFFWGIIGIGIDTDYFGGKIPQASWGLLFDDAIERIVLLDDMYVLTSVAVRYLFGHIDNLTVKQIEQVEELLIEQKKRTIAYTDLRTDHLLASKACPVAMTISVDLAKVMRRYSNIKFLIPKEGAFVSIDLFAIPSASNKDEFVYQFLNYLYRPDILQQYVDKFEFFAPIRSVALYGVDERLAIPSEELFKELHLLRRDIPTAVLHNIWMKLKV